MRVQRHDPVATHGHDQLAIGPLSLMLSVMALVAVPVLAGCGRSGEALPPRAETQRSDPDAVAVTVEPVVMRSVQRTVGLVGTLHGYEEITLGAKVAGRVRKILHDVSDHVRPGELLIEIEPTDYELNVRQAQRALQVEMAKLGLTEIPSAKMDVRHIPTVVQASLRRDNAKKRLERAMTLAERKAGTEEDVTEKRSDFHVAQAEYDNQILVAQTAIASIHVKQESLAIARQQLQDTLIRVPEPSQPIPGFEDGASYAVSGRQVAEGSYVMVGEALVKLVIERPLKFRGLVPERKSSEVRVGQKAGVVTSSYPEPFLGQVARINPAIDPKTRTFEVEILLPNQHGELKPGGFAKAGILTAVDEHAATVPLESLVQFAGVTKIFLVDGGKAQEVQVTLGVQSTDWVEIAAPKLPDGSQVVTSGQTAIAHGTSVSVRVVQPAAPTVPDKRVPLGEDAVAPVARREGVQ
jgi:RND family efflux transporter MFP subunit